MTTHGQRFQQIVQPDRAELGRSPAGSGQAGQGGFLEHPWKLHKISPTIGDSLRQTDCGKIRKSNRPLSKSWIGVFDPFPSERMQINFHFSHRLKISKSILSMHGTRPIE
jgi:hypothetical protein